MNALGKSCTAGCEAASGPDRFIMHGLTGEAVQVVGEEPRTGLVRLGAPPGDELLKESGAERDVAILATLALTDMDHHAGPVDVLDLETAEFGAAQTSGVEGHEDGAVAEVGGAVDE